MSTASVINNAATITDIYEAFGRGDIPFIISHIADNCKWIGTGERLLPQGGSSTGKDAVNFFSG
jgi:ketosteroid isomerase-like protein